MIEVHIFFSRIEASTRPQENSMAVKHKEAFFYFLSKSA